MSRPVTFTAMTKAAFRVEVFGREPTSVVSILLTGHGDEQDIELEEGSYLAQVTNIATGAKDSVGFDVSTTASEISLRIGAEAPPAPFLGWRSVGAEVKRGARAWQNQKAPGARGDNLPELRLRARTANGFRDFTGSRLSNASTPGSLKIVRPSSWAAHPVVRLDFETRRGNAVTCFVPLFSGGTLMRWDEAWDLVQLMPAEPKLAALVGGLDRSLRHEMPLVLRWVAGGDREDAMRFILARDDPWGAAAAGLLLVASGGAMRLGSWTLRYASRHDWLADFGVLGAWWQAASEPENEGACLQSLKGARQTGELYFWNSFRLAEQMLVALSGSAKSTALRAEARRELKRWLRKRAGVTRVGAFAAWSADKERP